MNIDIDALAVAVAAQLTAASASVPFGQTFTCVFRDTPIFTQEELADLHASIFPVTIIAAPSRTLPGQPKAHRFRGINEYQYVLMFGFDQRGPEGPPSTGTDPIIAFSAGLRLLTQEVFHWLNSTTNRRPTLDPAGTSLWLKTIEMKELYNLQELKFQRMFQSRMTLTYEEFVRE